MGMRRERNGDVFYVEQHTLWLPNEIMDEEYITFGDVLLRG